MYFNPSLLRKMAKEGEEFKQVPGLSYFISNFARVISSRTKRLRFMSPKPDRFGWVGIRATGPDGPICLSFHRLILELFKPKESSTGMFVWHKDGNTTNGRLENLEWVTQVELRRRSRNLHLGMSAEQAVCLSKSQEKICRSCVKIDWDLVSRDGRIDLNFLNRFKFKLNWKILRKREDLKDFIARHFVVAKNC